MKLISRLLIAIGIVFALSSCGGRSSYRIEGKLTNLKDTTVYAVFENGEVKVVDTVICKKAGQFFIKQKTGDFKTATVYFEQRSRWITIYLPKKGKYTAVGDAKYPELIQIKGGHINDVLSEFNKDVSSLLKEQTNLSGFLNKGNNINQNSAIEETDAASRLANVRHQLEEHAAAFIKKHPAEEASVVLINKYFVNPDDTRRLDELVAILNPKVKDFYMVRDLENYSTRIKRTVLGAEAPDFAVKNIYGKPLSIDSFAGKYLLLTFTAPWCDMCQTENLYLDEVANKYPKDKLSLLLVSLDDNPTAVREVLAKDKIKWNLVTDSAGQAVQLLDLYNVSALPRTYLIDGKGTIILKADNGIEIRQTLDELFNKNTEKEMKK